MLGTLQSFFPGAAWTANGSRSRPGRDVYVVARRTQILEPKGLGTRRSARRAAGGPGSSDTSPGGPEGHEQFALTSHWAAVPSVTLSSAPAIRAVPPADLVEIDSPGSRTTAGTVVERSHIDRFGWVGVAETLESPGPAPGADQLDLHVVRLRSQGSAPPSTIRPSSRISTPLVVSKRSSKSRSCRPRWAGSRSSPRSSSYRRGSGRRTDSCTAPIPSRRRRSTTT